MHAAIFVNPRFNEKGFQDSQPTVAKFRTDMHARIGQLGTVQTMVWEGIAQSGVLLASFLRDDDGNPFKPPSPNQPSHLDFKAVPEIKVLTDEIDAIQSAMSANPLADHDEGKYIQLNNQRKTKLAGLVNAAVEKWKAEQKKWEDHMFLCLALRKMGQDEALLFLEEVRGHLYISLRYTHRCDVHDTFLLHQQEAKAAEEAEAKAKAKAAAEEAKTKAAAEEANVEASKDTQAIRYARKTFWS